VKRIDALRAIAGCLADDLVVCNQGGNSQDWHHLRPANNFYMQHSMGLTTAIALGLAKAQPGERIWAFEGDGGMLMSLGMFGVIARARPRNLKVLLFDNENHECGGPYPTLTRDAVDLAAVALACGWDGAEVVRDEAGLERAVIGLRDSAELRLVVAKVEVGTDGDPMTIDAVEAKHRFVRDVERKLGITVIHPPEHYSTTF
jgi:thiamine pyrophosphate-dependent acetolactate synthase large subunit-like protein